MMRGADTFTESLFTLRKLEDFVPADHPLRSIRKMANAALAKMNALFSGMYVADIKGGRPSMAPEKLLRAMAAASAVQRALRAALDGASPIQPVVSLVHWAVDGR
jgi:hypothetical protein